MKSLRTALAIITLMMFGWANAQTTWYELNVPTSNKLNDIEFVSNSVGYIVGDNSTLLKTQDGGATWSAVNFSGIPAPYDTDGYFKDIDFVDESIGYLVIENYFRLLKTEDGGNTWNVWNSPDGQTNNCYLHCIYANDSTDWFLGGSGCFSSGEIMQYDGSNFTFKQMNYLVADPMEFVKQMDFKENIGLAAMNGEYMLRSDDSGQSWDTVHIVMNPGSVLTSVMIASNDTCYAGYDQMGGGFGMLISADFGLTWEQDFSAATFFYPAYYGFTEASNGKIYCGAEPSFSDAGLIFERFNGFWNYYVVPQGIYAMDSYGVDITFGVGDSGLVVVNQNPATLGIQELASEKKSATVYPNPVEELLHFDCDGCQVDTYRVMDISGREIISVDQVTTNELNTQSWPQGVYLLELYSDKTLYTSRFIKK